MSYRTLVIFLSLASLGAAFAGDEPEKAKLRGADTSSLKVMIRTIDDGEILWAGNYQLGTQAEVAPGQHKINVMCEFRYSWGTKLMPGNVTLDFEPGKTYDLVGAVSSDEKQCEIQADVRT